VSLCWRSALAICITALAVGAASFAWANRAGELQPWSGVEKPAFTLSTIDSIQFNLAALRGQPVLVHFFATWCEPCREELPALRRLVTRAANRQVAVVAVSVAEVRLPVKRFIEQTPINFPVLLDEDRAVARAWEVTSLPTTFVLDAALKPRFAIAQDYDWDRLDLDGLVEKLAADPSRRPNQSTANSKEIDP